MQKESKLAEFATQLAQKSHKLRELELMKAHSRDILSCLEEIHSTLEDIEFITGRGYVSRRCTVCSDGFYVHDHCSGCGHEEYQ